MAEIKPTAQSAAKHVSSVKPKRSSNAISFIAPVLAIILGYIIWRFVLGDKSHFNKPGTEEGFWPDREDPKGALYRMYQGGLIVPILIGLLLIVITFSIERFLTIARATGKGNIGEFIRNIQYNLANKDVDKAIALCDKQQGSVGNVMKQGLLKYKEMISNTELDTEQKVLNIQKEVEEATALELPMLEKNLVFLSTISSVATLMGLLGTVIGMIRSFASLASSEGGNASTQLSQGISEALYNTALGIGTSAVAVIMYNILTTRIDGITFGIDESGFTLTQSFASNYK
ncbi:MAG: MotA/TolQ/ExbB proton channel family protein [Arachidicoccus sp.]|nr:MotA/TolQ/ExbB proton channel family protein [Arachidicoccus sp.]